MGKDKCDDIALIGDQIYSISEGSLVTDRLERICIADGVGGNNGGDIASRFVMEKIIESGERIGKEELKDKLFKINNELLCYAAITPGVGTMATTFSGIFYLGTDIALAHCGNTRIYSLQGKFLKQITADQTVYQWLMDTGNEEAAAYCNKNEIRGAFGGGDEKYIRLLTIKKIFERGWPPCVLMTSDGIHDVLEIDLIEEVVREDDKPGLDKVIRLVEEAVKQGSTDDCTAIIIET